MANPGEPISSFPTTLSWMKGKAAMREEKSDRVSDSPPRRIRTTASSGWRLVQRFHAGLRSEPTLFLNRPGPKTNSAQYLTCL